jgi:hypothetical protein
MMRTSSLLKRTGVDEVEAGSLLRRAFRRFRLPLRTTTSVEETAARTRVERLFEVNFRSTWTR